MSDDKSLGTGDQRTVGAATPPSPAPGVSEDEQTWKARYTGAVQTMDKQAAELKTWQAKTAQMAQQVNDTEAKNRTAEAETAAAKKAVEDQAKVAQDQLKALNDQVQGLTAYKTKMEVLRQFPRLVQLADMIPELPDTDVLRKHCETLQAAVDSAVTEEVARKTAGYTPGPTTPKPTTGRYDTVEAWMQALSAAPPDKFPLISQDFLKWQQSK